MQNLKDFFRTTLGKSVERYLWHIAVLSLGLLIVVGVDLDIKWLIAVSPLITQLTKFLNLKYIKN